MVEGSGVEEAVQVMVGAKQREREELGRELCPSTSEACFWPGRTDQQQVQLRIKTTVHPKQHLFKRTKTKTKTKKLLSFVI